MNIGIIGTGNMGQALAPLWAAREHQVVLGSREPGRIQERFASVGRGVRVDTQQEAAAFGDVVVLVVPWFAVTDVIREVGELLREKVVVDAINPLMSSGSLALGHKTSAAEEIQRMVPRAHVVKAFNHIHYTLLSQPDFNGTPADAFYCSNYDDAKEVARQLAADLGFHPVDSGPLKNARLLEPLALFWIQLAFNQGLGTDFAIKLIHR